MKIFSTWTLAALLAAAILTSLQPEAANAESTPNAATVKELMLRELAGAPDKEVRVLTVRYLPGGSSPPHRHNAQVFVYVLEGSVKMQVKGAPAVTLGPGEAFYEGPDDIHVISANASQTAAARILVFIIKSKGAPVSMVTDAERTP